MGTRADFYVGRGESAEWLGSIGWDGYPDGIPPYVLGCKDETLFRKQVRKFLKSRDDASFPKDGWPWPWDDSRTTDYAYAFDKGHVRASYFGYAWFNPRRPPADTTEGEKVAVFPNLSKTRRQYIFGKHSGVMIISAAK